MTKESRLVLFDFDGTITTRDTLFTFTRFAVGNLRFLLGLSYLALPLALHRLNLFPAQQAKELFFKHFFRNTKHSKFLEICQLFGMQIIPKIIRPLALKAILEHQRQGDRIVIISASAHDWIYPWASEYKVEVIATQLETKNEILTGMIAGKNCNGFEKVNRIKEVINLSDYEHIIAYGDSEGDIPMINLADQKFYKPFR
jgi:phosphatidylglycerophosphatase C